MSLRRRTRQNPARATARQQFAAGTSTPDAFSHALHLHQTGRCDEAERIYRDILRTRPDHADALHLLGLLAHQRGDHRRAVELISQAIAADPENSVSHGNLAEVYRTLERYDAAIKAARRALARNPNYAEALNTLGAALQAQGDMDQAVAALEQATKIKPDFAGALANLGNVLRAQGKLGEAETRYREALRIDPRMAEVHLSLGDVLQAQEGGRLDEALECCRQALRLKPGWAEVHYNLGTLFRRLGRIDEAVASYQEALRIKPDFAAAHFNLGVTFEQVHRLDEARQAANLALKHDPNHSLTKLLLARLDRRSDKLAAARKRLSKLLRSDLAPLDFARVSVELGHVLDRMGDYAKAFEAFETGQRTWSDSVVADRAKPDSFHQTIARNRTWFTRDRVSGWGDAAVDDDPSSPIFLVGFPRSGTTLTEQILGSHPGLVTADERPLVRKGLVNELPAVLGREAPYPQCLADLNPTHIRRLRACYWEQANKVVGPNPDGRRLVDKLPLNIVDLGLIHRVFPDAPILVALRDPRDVCLSCFMQAFRPNEAMMHFFDLTATARLYEAVMNLWLQYRTILNLRSVEIRYEDLVADFEPTVRRIINFVGVYWDDSVLRYHETDKHRYVSTPSYESITLPIYSRSVGRWRNYEEQLKPILGVLEPFVKEFGYAEDSDGAANGIH